MRFTRTQFLDLMTFGDCPRQMFSELFGLLVGVDQEWSSQGASRQEVELTAFDWDYVPFVECGGNTGPLVTGPPETIHEDDETLIQRDHLGRRPSHGSSSGTTGPLRHPPRAWPRRTARHRTSYPAGPGTKTARSKAVLTWGGLRLNLSCAAFALPNALALEPLLASVMNEAARYSNRA